MTRLTVCNVYRSLLLRENVNAPLKRAINVSRSAPVVCGFALAMMILHWWRPGSVIMGGDSVFFPSPFVQITTSLAAWNHVASLTGNYAPTCTYFFLLIVSGALHVIFGYSLSQIVLLWGLIFGAWLAAYSLARKLGVSSTAAAISAWLYAVNPWSEQFYVYNYQLEVLEMFVPLIAVWLIDAGSGDPKKLVAKIALFSAVPASVFGINPAVIALALFAIVPLVPLAIIVTRRHDAPRASPSRLRFCAHAESRLIRKNLSPPRR